MIQPRAPPVNLKRLSRGQLYSSKDRINPLGIFVSCRAKYSAMGWLNRARFDTISIKFFSGSVHSSVSSV